MVFMQFGCLPREHGLKTIDLFVMEAAPSDLRYVARLVGRPTITARVAHVASGIGSASMTNRHFPSRLIQGNAKHAGAGITTVRDQLTQVRDTGSWEARRLSG